MALGRHGRPNSPADEHQRGLRELANMATFARESYPDAKVETLGDLIELGEKAIQEEVRKLDDERPT
jgi:hypothetical protein